MVARCSASHCRVASARHAGDLGPAVPRFLQTCGRGRSACDPPAVPGGLRFPVLLRAQSGEADRNRRRGGPDFQDGNVEAPAPTEPGFRGASLASWRDAAGGAPAVAEGE